MHGNDDLRRELLGLVSALKNHVAGERDSCIPASRLGRRASGRPQPKGAIEGDGATPVAASKPAWGKGPGSLDAVREELGDCTRCPLHRTRRTLVFGEGSPRARLVFVGEAPGEEEDRQGRPFVGRAGQLLTKIINAMGLAREEV